MKSLRGLARALRGAHALARARSSSPPPPRPPILLSSQAGTLGRHFAGRHHLQSCTFSPPSPILPLFPLSPFPLFLSVLSVDALAPLPYRLVLTCEALLS